MNVWHELCLLPIEVLHFCRGRHFVDIKKKLISQIYSAKCDNELCEKGNHEKEVLGFYNSPIWSFRSGIKY